MYVWKSFACDYIYMEELNQMHSGQSVWKPYTDRALPDYVDVRRESELWLDVPLIHLEVVKWHQPDQLICQLNLRKHLPQLCDTTFIAYSGQMGTCPPFCWTLLYASVITFWQAHICNMVTGTLNTGFMEEDDLFMLWYQSITYPQTNSQLDLVWYSSHTQYGVYQLLT